MGKQVKNIKSKSSLEKKKKTYLVKKTVMETNSKYIRSKKYYVKKNVEMC